MKTRITELLAIEHPIIQGGMHFVGFAELAAAVSNAGGLGIITGLTQGTPERLSNEIARCQDMTDKPFGVNLTFLPSLTPPDYPGLVQTIIDSGVKIVETAGNNPAQYLPPLKDAGSRSFTNAPRCGTRSRRSRSAAMLFLSMALSVVAIQAKMTFLISFYCRVPRKNSKYPLLHPEAWPMRVPWLPHLRWALKG